MIKGLRIVVVVGLIVTLSACNLTGSKSTMKGQDASDEAVSFADTIKDVKGDRLNDSFIRAGLKALDKGNRDSDYLNRRDNPPLYPST